MVLWGKHRKASLMCMLSLSAQSLLLAVCMWVCDVLGLIVLCAWCLLGVVSAIGDLGVGLSLLNLRVFVC